VSDGILVGYSVPDGKPVRIKPVHVGFTGMTREAGKTTAMEALIDRSGMTALVFKTKLGEGESRLFADGEPLDWFYRQKSDWQYVESLLEATVRENMKFNRSYIRLVCQGTRNLEQVWDNVRERLKKVKEGSFLWSIYYNLDGYFELTVPYLNKFESLFTQTLELAKGRVNVMDLEAIADELPEDAAAAVQSLIIRATLEEVYQRHPDTIVGMPESWQFIPAGKAITPVNDIAETIVRKGAVRRIYLWPDSQDIAGLAPRVRGQISTWLLGKQTYEHEVDRTVGLVPLPASKRPKAENIQTLDVGQFYLVSGGQCTKVYVQPRWLPEDVAVRVARGEVALDSKEVQAHKPTAPPVDVRKEPSDMVFEDWTPVVEAVERVEAKLE
jgi:hypothetical protein